MSNQERRQIENEMIFRKANEKTGDDLGALDAMHIEDGNIDLLRQDDLLLHVMCECSDENCTKRIPMNLSVYEVIHAHRDKFIVLPGHQVKDIETVTSETPIYLVVKKNKRIAEPTKGLLSTSVDNS